MKKNTVLVCVLLLSIVLFAPVAMAKGPEGEGCGGCSGQGHGKNAGQGQHQGMTVVLERLETLPVGTLSDDEAAALIYLREEEKLARDVYTTLGAKWDRQVFSNIAGAEQRHMDLVKALLDRYEIEDPVVDDTTGAFTDPGLGKLYTELVASGESSLEQALLAGATIEDKDIFDLYALIESSDNADVKLVANNLVKGSRNHLRAYAKNLSKQGADEFKAQHLEQSVFDEIASSERERGVVYDENGDELSVHGGHGSGKGHGQGKGQGCGQGQGKGKGQGQGQGGHGQKGACKNTTGS